uniref:Ring finger protein 207 n=1 Tax=Anas zonorhyncha TaxID=75864 RepID=A0A8B9ZWM4_9AVES
MGSPLSRGTPHHRGHPISGDTSPWGHPVLEDTSTGDTPLRGTSFPGGTPPAWGRGAPTPGQPRSRSAAPREAPSRARPVPAPPLRAARSLKIASPSRGRASRAALGPGGGAGGRGRGRPVGSPADGRGHLLPAGELLGAGEGRLAPAGVPAVPRALPAPLPARLLPQFLCQLPARPRHRRPPALPPLRAPLGGEGGHGAAPRGPAPAVPRGQLGRRRGGRAVRQLRPALCQGGSGCHVLLQHLQPAPLRPVPRGDAPRQGLRPPRDRFPLQAHQGNPQEVPTARGALHHVLHREEVHALHQLLQGHAGGEPGALHRHRDGVRAGLREAGPGGAGGEGAADVHARGHRPPQGHDRGGAQQCQPGGDGHQRPLQRHAGAALREKEGAPESRAEVHLVICSAFLSSANKAEFLDLGYQLMERLQRIVKLPHRLRPAQTSKINTEYRAEFARCLEPLLMLTPRRSVVGSAGGIGPGIAGTNMIPVGQSSKTLMVPGCPPSGDKMSTGSMVRKPTLHRYISTKVLLAEGRETPFAEHCRNYENTYRMLQTEIQGLKDQVQELHRDLTKHHSLIRTEIMSEILQKSLQMDVQIAAHYSSVEMMRSVFEEVWEETYQRVANEQEIYEAQLHDLLQLRQENSCLTTITKQIAPYVRSIAKVKERLEPRLQEPREPKDEHTQTLLRIEDSSEAAQRYSSPKKWMSVISSSSIRSLKNRQDASV